MNVAVVGSGYVGLVAAACYAEFGHQVMCVDQDQERVAALNAGKTPVHEQFLPELLQRHRGIRLTFTSRLADAARDAQVIVIAVGTPARDSGEADLSAVEAVAADLAPCITGYKVIAEKSTVPVSTNERIRAVMRAHGASPSGFDVVSNPEFLREGSAVMDFLYPDRIVVGADTLRSTETMIELYRPLTESIYAKSRGAVPAPDGARIPTPLIVTSVKSAELIKHASNSFLAMKISFINAVARICEHVGADVLQVCQGIGADSRIGEKFLGLGSAMGAHAFRRTCLHSVP